MKRWNQFTVLALLVVLVSGFSTSVLAFGGPGMAREEGWGPGCEKGNRLGLQRLQQVADILELTEGQREQMQVLFEAQRATMQPMKQKVRELRRQLRDAMWSDSFDEAQFRSLAAQQAAVKEEMLVARGRMHEKVRAILTPEQKRLLQKLRPLLSGPKGGGPKI